MAITPEDKEKIIKAQEAAWRRMNAIIDKRIEASNGRLRRQTLEEIKQESTDFAVKFRRSIKVRSTPA